MKPPPSSGVALCPGSGLGSHGEPLGPDLAWLGGGLGRDLCFSSLRPRGLGVGPEQMSGFGSQGLGPDAERGLQLISPLNILRTSAPVSKTSPSLIALIIV